ncbi:MAG: 3-isopropylmalate dehydrogenase [Lachnospiraceae bacterium]|nr:3-isopropylmalate dehydrogenase [Lachnospiraceae bacterium]
MGKEAEETAYQWHPAFFAGIQIEFSEEKEKLTFENEHHLGTKPKQIDVLIIKKESETELQKNIGKIFRRYNIIEYKSPKDYLSIDDFYQVYGYACFFKSDAKQVDEIKAEEITITFVCKNKPKKLIKYLQEERELRIEGNEGIYVMHGDFFAMQLLVTSELSKKENFWLRYLTDDLKTVEEANKILGEYEGHQKENLYKSVMNMIVTANKEVFKEAKKVCEALRELMKEELEEIKKVAMIDGRNEGRNEGRIEGRIEGERDVKIRLIQTKLSKGKTLEAIAEDLEDSVENILTLIKEMDQKEEN